MMARVMDDAIRLSTTNTAQANATDEARAIAGDHASADVARAERTWSEQDRLAALQHYRILDTGREAAFDDMAALVADLLDAPIAVVNLIASDRQWFKAEVGIGTDSLPLDVSICRHAVLQPGVTVVPDLQDDPRFVGNPLIHVEGGLRFYAGARLETPEGLPLGTLCVLDREPRPGGISERQRRALAVLASQVMAQMELRRAKEEAQVASGRQSFLLRLEERLRGLADSEDILCEVPALLGRHLGLDRVGYTEIVGGTTVRMIGCYAVNGMGPLTGEVPLASFGEERIARQRQGLTEVCDDVLADPERDTQVWNAISTRSVISVPLVRDGEFRASLYVNNRSPRRWTAEEVTLVEEVASRTWDAVERARAMAALRESEARMRVREAELIEAQRLGRIGSWWFDLRTQRTTGTAELWRIYGLDPEKDPLPEYKEQRGTLYSEETWDRIDAAVADTMRTGVGYELDVEAFIDGRSIWVTTRSEPVCDASGDVIGLRGTVQDITARKEAEAAYQRQAEELSAVYDAAPVGLCVLDRDLRYVRINQRLAEINGVPPEDHIGRTVKEVVPALNDQVLTFFDRVLGGEALLGLELTGVTPARPGVLRAWRENWVPLRGLDGQVTGIALSAEEITEERAAAAALKASEERLRLVQAAGGIGSFDYDMQKDEAICSPEYYQILGLPDGSPISRETWAAMVHPEDRHKAVQALNRAIMERIPFDFEYRIVRADNGEVRWLSGRAAVLFDSEGRPWRYVGGNIDITKLKEVEARLRELNDSLEQRVEERTRELMAAEDALHQSQKMEAVGQLTGGLAHDFNNLLAGISGSLELMGTRIAQGRHADVERYLSAAQGASRRAAALTHRLLAFSRRQTLAPKVTDVNALVGGMEDLIRRTVGPEVVVQSVTGSGVWPVEVDPNQLENALLNLAINARDAMPEGGRLTIETANRWMDARAAREQDLSPGQYVSLCVTDTGTGMTPEVIARAFDPFFTTKPLGAGTGLGLSMVYGFARQSGGQVRIYSEVGQGTTVCLYLPRHVGDEAEQPSSSGIEAGVPVGAGETVLVIDDEPVVRMLVVDVLEELGYAALEASDGPEGLKVLQSKARVDLLISDVGLPGGLNGRQVADAARALRPDLKVLFITGYAENAVLNNGHLEHGMHVVTKPFAVEDLARRIRAILVGEH